MTEGVHNRVGQVYPTLPITHQCVCVGSSNPADKKKKCFISASFKVLFFFGVLLGDLMELLSLDAVHEIERFHSNV